MAKNPTTNDEEAIKNQIGKDTHIKGDITSEEGIRFDGSLMGNLKVSGRVVIGSTGQVKGEITCDKAYVEGKIEGKITVKELLTLKGTARIEGDIVAKQLAIDPGAVFTGSCNMTGNGSSVIKENPPVKK